MRARAIHSGEASKLFDWAAEYHRNNPYPRTGAERWGIGIYQIFQFMKWKSGGHEALAAAAIHFAGSASEFEQSHLSALLLVTEEIVTAPFVGFGLCHEKLLFNIGKGQQMIIYATAGKGTQRGSRFKASRLADATGVLFETLVQCIPSELREESFYEAMDIVCGRL